MDQIMLVAICRITVGHNDRQLGHPNITTAYTQGLFADYYCYNPYVYTKTLYKHANATTPYPHFFVQHYSGICRLSRCTPSSDISIIL